MHALPCIVLLHSLQMTFRRIVAELTLSTVWWTVHKMKTQMQSDHLTNWRELFDDQKHITRLQFDVAYS